MARWSRSFTVRKFPSTYGMMQPVSSSAKRAYIRVAAMEAGIGVDPMLPYGMTTIMGSAFPSAMRLSRMVFSRPTLNQVSSVSVVPLIR